MLEIPENSIIRLNEIREPVHVIFIISGIEGNVAGTFADLAQHLASKGRILVYGIEFSRRTPVDTIESIADNFLTLIQRELVTLNKKSFTIVGYSFGGLVAVEVVNRALEIRSICVETLILLESSVKLFNYGVHVNAKQFDQTIANEPFISNKKILAGPLSIYVSFLIGNPMSKELKHDLYDYLMIQCPNDHDLDALIGKLFEYIKRKKYYEFDSEREEHEMRDYLKLMILKSHAAFVYRSDKKLPAGFKVHLLRSENFLYRNFLDQVYYLDDSGQRLKFEMDERDLSAGEIMTDTGNDLRLTVFQKGNHWTFINENLEEISQIISSIVQTKSKLS